MAFIPDLLGRLHIECLFHGNLTKEVGETYFSIYFKESDPPTLHCAPVVVYERGGPQKLSFHDNASFKNSDRSKITN